MYLNDNNHLFTLQKKSKANKVKEKKSAKNRKRIYPSKARKNNTYITFNYLT
jgi:hypothetical protein